MVTVFKVISDFSLQSKGFSHEGLFCFAQVSFSPTVRLNTRLPGLAVIIDTEVTDPLELKFLQRLHRCQRWLNLASGEYGQ